MGTMDQEEIYKGALLTNVQWRHNPSPEGRMLLKTRDVTARCADLQSNRVLCWVGRDEKPTLGNVIETIRP